MSKPNSENFGTKVSVIIPAFNEEQYIENTVTALKQHAPTDTEIIVIDNGSTDSTAKIAESLGVSLFVQTEGTIASLRNRGVEESSGDILIFIDADVTVTEAWGKELVQTTIPNLAETPMLVTGSRCLPPDNGNILNTYWFSLLNEYEAPYINSGHLITSKQLFSKIEGFSGHLKTAEDYDFCMKAKACGAALVNNSKLPVYHYGYPETVSRFIARERWHGREDFETWNSFLDSKVGLAAAGNLTILLLALGLFLSSFGASYLFAYLIIMYLTCTSLTLYKFDLGKLKSLPMTSGIFYLYLTGRSLALLDRLKSLVQRKAED